MGAWIETSREESKVQLTGSHPTWVRGLKQIRVITMVWQRGSHPTWVRGLKPANDYHYFNVVAVAPYVGAWIETCDT